MKTMHQLFSFSKTTQVLANGLMLCLTFSPFAYGISPESLSQSPLFLVTSADPLVMLNMSNDHQLFYKAYDDWSDINNDSVLDITYAHGIDYYGYFDSYKCYTYDTTDNRFEPDSITADKYCTGASDWSGNFLNWATMTRMDSVKKILFGGTRSTDTDTSTVLERSYLPGDAHSFAKFYATTTTEMAKLTPWSVAEITLCNTTYAADGESEDITEPPLIRVADGNYALWAANERYQCHWKDHSELEGSRSYDFLGPGSANNGNNPAVTGLDAHHSNPEWDERLGDGDYVVRVEACVSKDLQGKENCKAYPDGNLKPIGLLQQYGDDSQIMFGLMTGSFQHNKSGGTLRKNVSAIIDEINTASDGTFISAPVAGNIIKNLDALRVSGYDHDPGTYNDTDNCAWGLNSFTNGNCTNWGNPQSEIYLESLRYFAGASADASFTSDDSSYINNFVTSSWTDPLSDANYCAPINIIHFNASVSSYDDEFSGTADLNDLSSLNTFTDAVGAGEGINGHSFFIGEGTSATTTDGLCTAKSLTGLSDANGLCPEAPRLDGGFSIAGLAHYAHITSIRDDLVDTDNNEAEVTLKTYGVALSPAIPKIEVPIPGGSNIVTILPACRNASVSGNCAIVDFKVVDPHTTEDGITTGKFYVNWEDSEQGGDYDQDMAGILSYAASSGQIKVTTAVFGESTGDSMGFGYIISGTTLDGFHVHSGINDFTGYEDATGVLSCSDEDVTCSNEEDPTTVTYNIGTSSGGLLNDPLWYAAKWGGFEEEADPDDRPTNTNAPNDIPDQDYEWDANNDGMPDTYFFSTDPAQLATSLGKVFLNISEQQASASSTAANSQRAETGSYIYQAQFSSEDWSGKLLKYSVDVYSGTLTLDSTWGTNGSGNAGDTLTESGRTIITYNPENTGPSNDGIGFTWDEMTDAQETILNIDPISGDPDTNGQYRLDYLRGDRSRELQNGGTFRNRSGVLGDIINSSPVYVGEPAFLYSNILEADTVETYSEFKTRVASRTGMIYVGGNDGMLHGFNASSGLEELAYVPYGVFANLTNLTSLNYAHHYFVDGSPSVVDAVFSDNRWHTVLLGGLNAGGQSIYALDVTDPSSFAEDSASQTVLWEIAPTTITGVDEDGVDELDFSELGYSFSRPAIVKNHRNSDGGWIGIFGNGYASASGHAILYVVDLEYGTLISSITVDNSGSNGLTTASPVDMDGDDKIDAIYAGDLKGHMWKFIPSTGNTWKAAFSGSPLFTAPADLSGYVQPITTRPEAGLHPTGLPGVIVYFGTGKYFENGDNVADSNVNRFYAIWDLWNEGDTSTLTYPSRTIPTTPNISVSGGNLLQQCVTTGTTAETCATNAAAVSGEVLQNHEVRFISSNSISVWDWVSTNGKMGWYLDLPEYGEKQVSHSILRAGRIIFITVVPSDHSCSDGGESWLMELDATDGSALDIPVFDLNLDGNFDEDDMKLVDTDGDGENDTQLIPGGKRSKEGIIQPPSILINTDTGKEFKFSSGSTGNIEKTTENPGKMSQGRKSWVQLK